MNGGLKFTIVLPPTGQKRARSRAVQTGGRAYAMTYKDKGQRLQEDKLITLMYEYRPPEPLSGPLLLKVSAYLPIPKSKSKKWQAAALAGKIRPTSKPDCSNLLKNIEDVMQGVFFEDDKNLVAAHLKKYYGDPARWEIEIRPWAPLHASSGNCRCDVIPIPEEKPKLHPELF